MTQTNLLTSIINDEDLGDFREWLARLSGREKGLYLRNDVIQMFNSYCDDAKKGETFRRDSSIAQFLKKVQVLFPSGDHIVVMRRHDIARYRFFLIRKDGDYIEETTLPRFLDLQNTFVCQDRNGDKHPHIDFLPFYRSAPSIRDRRSIGGGIRFLSRYLSSRLFSQPDEWNRKLFDFMRIQRIDGRSLMVNEAIIDNLELFAERLQGVLEKMRTMDAETPFREVEAVLAEEGFEAGWGDTVGRIADTMGILLDLIHEPDDQLLEDFISRVPIPLISRIAIISPHGWFGQTNTFGKPDTGGQVIYILDQVRVLERHLRKLLRSSGLDVEPQILVLTRLIPEAGGTTCDQRLEKIFNTDNCWILRVPFRDERFNIIKHWISRFQVWPYLENFAEDAAHELVGMFQGYPDLVIGNYSDGNLVASLLSDRFDAIQCTIAHALEKPKYHLSDVYWQEKEEEYNFSIQFTADIYSMNKSDFIITSTLQEIVGTEDTMGQYESYQFFTMPGLYQVHGGVNIFDPKFNVIHPGVDEELYFPYYRTDSRVQSAKDKLEHHIFQESSEDIFGELEDADRRPIFTMARFDRIKNITGLIEAFGISEKLQESCNLIFAAGTIHSDNTTDYEERGEIERALDLIERHSLNGRIRWLPSINKLDTGEAYRIMADRGGLFVQPALFEAFGLTILEAMASGLPTFAPKFGGPLEIIESGVNGFLVDTSRPEFIARAVEGFIDRAQGDGDHWKRISERGIERVREGFNWQRYSERLINLTKLYGFWRHAVSGQGNDEVDRYSDLIYHFLIRERAKNLAR
ncbi:MAG: sucrose synthase [bacterium]|nr:MAG: sucrose synthase [bacterium]